jgi:hypothetical protein
MIIHADLESSPPNAEMKEAVELPVQHIMAHPDGTNCIDYKFIKPLQCMG